MLSRSKNTHVYFRRYKFLFWWILCFIRLKNNNFSPKNTLYVFLTSNIFNSYLSNTIFGANINNLSSDILYNFKIPMPPIETQEQLQIILKY